MPLHLSLDTSMLPTDVLSLYDEDFYQIVQEIAGTAEAQLLEVQGIRSVYSFLNIEDVFDILTMSCAALKDIRKLICFEADDKTFTVKPGCRGNILYLSQLLHQKHEEHSKEIATKFKKKKQTQLQRNDATTMNFSQSSLQVGLNSSSQQQNISSIDSTINPIDPTDHHGFIIRVLDEWFVKYSRTFNLPNEKLIENEDFKLSIGLNGSIEEACISCSCGVKIRLTKFHGNFSLSNYYKHIKSKSCSMMKKKKTINSNRNEESTIINDDELTDNEVSQNDTTANYSQSSISTITCDKSGNIDKSVKRSTVSQASNSSIAKRIRK